MPLLLGLVAWFGLNYLFLTPVIADRTILKSCPASSRGYCQCIADVMLNDARLDLALWTSSLGFYEVKYSQKVKAARDRGEGICS